MLTVGEERYMNRKQQLLEEQNELLREQNNLIREHNELQSYMLQALIMSNNLKQEMLEPNMEKKSSMKM